MRQLDLSAINQKAPYKVSCSGNEYRFTTDNGILLAVLFEREYGFPDDAYWFVLSNRNMMPSPNDPKVRMTVTSIIEEFFAENPYILLYMCDTAHGQQAMRSRLFLRWFMSYENHQCYNVMTDIVMDEDVENYIALIIRIDHPHYDQIISFFNQMIADFKSNKP